MHRRRREVLRMAQLFGPAAAEPETLQVQDWSSERWTAPSAVHRLADYSLFGHPLYQRPALGGRLHWASTETADQYAGHIEGALAAAGRAVTASLTTTAPMTTTAPTTTTTSLTATASLTTDEAEANSCSR